MLTIFAFFSLSSTGLGHKKRVTPWQKFCQLDEEMLMPQSSKVHDSWLTRSFRYLLDAALSGGAYFVAARLGLLLAPPELAISLIWLSSGIALAAIYRRGWPCVAGIAVATGILQEYSFGIAWPLAGVVVAGQTLEPLLAACFLRLTGFDPEFNRRRDILLFAAAAIVGMVVSPTSGVLALGAAGKMPWAEIGPSWLSWWLGDGIGVLVVAPLLLSLRWTTLARTFVRRIEFVVWLAATTLTSSLVFFWPSTWGITHLPLIFLPLVLLVWSAMRLYIFAASLGVLLLGVAATFGTALGRGPFIQPEILHGVFFLWSYLGTASLLTLMITGIEIGRTLAEKKLRDSETSLLHANASLRTARQSAEQHAAQARHANEAKSVFLARMSHDIRTPMNGVVGMADLLLETPLDDSQREYVEIIHNSGDVLLRLLSDILDFSKIEAGKLEIHPELFDPARIVRETTRLVATRASQKGLALSVDIPADLPERWISDSGRIRQVLMNLIENAIKFTDAGSVIVRARPSNDGAHRLVFEVEDTGKGISQKELDAIFQPFVQAAEDQHVPDNGFGLGLSICRHLAGLLGGELKVRTTPGRGSTFSLIIPEKSAGQTPA